MYVCLYVCTYKNRVSICMICMFTCIYSSRRARRVHGELPGPVRGSPSGGCGGGWTPGRHRAVAWDRRGLQSGAEKLSTIILLVVESFFMYIYISFTAFG